MTRVLWHLSHHSSLRPDGWSGAPDEARWIREDLTPRVIASCRLVGVEVITVDGDLEDHPEFHQDYAAFVAPHYESDSHDDHVDEATGLTHRGGWFWGRAAASATAAQDDGLGAIFERRYRRLLARFPDGPDEHSGWMTVNVTNYYGFRYTTARTPGILVELGVGDPADPSDDGAWLRAHVADIADVFALTLAEFAGGAPVAATTPKLIEQSPDLPLVLKKGEVGHLLAVYDYGEGKGRRTIDRKVYSHTAERRAYFLYPPADPDADPTETLDAEAAIFVIDITPA